MSLALRELRSDKCGAMREMDSSVRLVTKVGWIGERSFGLLINQFGEHSSVYISEIAERNILSTTITCLV